MADLYRMSEENFRRQLNRMRSHFYRQGKELSEPTETMRATNQRLVDLQHEAQQPRLVTEEDVQPNIKIRKRTEDAGADRVKNGDISFARVDDSLTSLTSFDMLAERPALLMFRDDVLVDKVTEAPKPCLPPVEMRTPTAADGLLPAGTTYTAMGIIFTLPYFSWIIRKTKNTDKYGSEINCRINVNQLAPSC